MRFIQRNEAGEVIGHYANPQVTRAGVLYTEPEPLADDHPDIVAWDARRRTPRGKPLPTITDLLLRLEALEKHPSLKE